VVLDHQFLNFLLHLLRDVHHDVLPLEIDLPIVLDDGSQLLSLVLILLSLLSLSVKRFFQSDNLFIALFLKK
jgi:hypothetical protein